MYGTLSGTQPVINLARSGTYSASSYEIQNGVSHLPEYAFDGFGQNVGSNGKAYRVIQQEEVKGNGKSVQMNLNRAMSSGTYILQVLEANRTIHSKQILISR